ncbi:MAG TPA: electron transport complex subunit E [Spirochaetia bacterium]|nr:electron transport complex subunit E [Spirochaetia bacterium]
MADKSILAEFTKGFGKENPTFVQVLGMCPTLAVTSSVANGLGMGLATLFVLFFSVLMTALIKKVVPDGVRIAVYTVVIATFVTIADLFMRAYVPPLSKALGPYVPLIVVNCIILGRIEAFTTKNPIGASLVDALGMGAGFTTSLLVIGAVREILGSGQLLGHQILGPGFHPLLVMILPPGAFLTLGILMAVFNAVKNRETVVVVGGN